MIAQRKHKGKIAAQWQPGTWQALNDSTPAHIYSAVLQLSVRSDSSANSNSLFANPGHCNRGSA